MDMWGGMCVCEDSKLSKAEILRGLITDKLTTAAREIFAVVERTVTGYEDEVSGLKQEVDRQRRQLEAVLQPQVSLCRIDHDELSPVCGVENGDSGGAEDTADTYSLEDYEHEGDEGKEEPAQISGLGREILQEVNNHTPYSIAEGAGSGNECRTPDSSREGLTDSPTDSGSSNTKRKRSIPVNSAADSKGEANEKKLEDGDEDWRALSTGNKKRPLKLSVCFLDNWPADVLSNIVFKKCPIQELLCPHGLQEEDFLKLLRSVFPKLAADKAFDVYMTDRTRILQPLKLETLTPERIWRALRSTGAGKSSLYIRLKTAQLDLFQRNASTDSPSTSAAVMTSDETRQHTSVVQCKQETTMHVEETEEDIGGGEEMNDGDDSWKPDVTEGEQDGEAKSSKTRRKGGSNRIKSSPRVLTANSDAVVSCKVCGVLYKSKNIVIRHAWCHVDDPKRLCGVCGQHTESAEKLRSHLQGHRKTHICNICGKTFITLNDFQEHSAGHTGQKPHKCDICGKGFFLRYKLTAHMKKHLLGKLKFEICKKPCS